MSERRDGHSALVWDKNEGSFKAVDLHPETFVIAPNPKAWEQAASVICGHDFIQEMTDDRQAEFHSFVREVLRTVVGKSGRPAAE